MPKLTRPQREEIRQSLASGSRVEDLAQRYAVHVSTIRRCVQGCRYCGRPTAMKGGYRKIVCQEPSCQDRLEISRLAAIQENPRWTYPGKRRERTSRIIDALARGETQAQIAKREGCTQSLVSWVSRHKR